jgi:hypothetical protein
VKLHETRCYWTDLLIRRSRVRDPPGSSSHDTSRERVREEVRGQFLAPELVKGEPDGTTKAGELSKCQLLRSVLTTLCAIILSKGRAASSWASTVSSFRAKDSVRTQEKISWHAE